MVTRGIPLCVRGLALQHGLALVLEDDFAEGVVVVAGEDDQPLFRDGARVEALALLVIHEGI